MSAISAARRYVFENFFDIDGKSQFARSLDKFITWLLVVNLAALVIEHIPGLYATHEVAFGVFDRISIYFLLSNMCSDCSRRAATPAIKVDASSHCDLRLLRSH